MIEPHAIPTTGRIAVIDLGSNSLRLVVFDCLGGALFPLLNERVLCGLGRGIASTGRLNAEGKALALVNLRRFVALASAVGVEHLAVLATAAVRDASDGRSFAAQVELQCRVPVKIIDGAEEARLSAAHRSPIHCCPAGGRGLFRHHRAAVTEVTRKDYHDLAQAP